MEIEMTFKKLLSQYAGIQPEEIGNDMKLREDLNLSSLDLMTLLGEVEDTFDIEFEEEGNVSLSTVGDAITLIGERV